MKVVIFTEHNVTPWWRRVAARLNFASTITIVSPFAGDGDFFFMPDFYRYHADPTITGWAHEHLGQELVTDIRERCRWLRALDPTEADRMIGAMWRTVEDMVERFQPAVFLSLLIDIYVSDIMERILRRRGLRFIGFNASIRPNLVMFSSRGEYIPLRTPTENEVDAAIAQVTAPGFTAYLPAKSTFGLRRFLWIYAWWNARAVAFWFIRRFSGNPLNHHYNVVPDVIPEFQVNLSNYLAKRYLMADWAERISSVPFERRVFVGLQVNPEASTDYWIPDRSLIDYPKVLHTLISTLKNAGYTVLLKEHPVMFGFRARRLFQEISHFSNVVFIPYDIPAPVLIEKCQYTFTWTGTVGFQAAMAGRCAIVADPYYTVRSHFLVIKSLDDIAGLPERMAAFRAPGDLKAVQRAIMQKLLAASVPGYISDRGLARRGNPAACAHAEEIAETLNQYLPPLLAADISHAAKG